MARLGAAPAVGSSAALASVLTASISRLPRISTSCSGKSERSNPARDTDQLGDRWNNVFYGGYYLFGSAHPAGINAVFGDGSVHSVKFGIDPQTFNALGRMDDGTNLHVDPDNIQ